MLAIAWFDFSPPPADGIDLGLLRALCLPRRLVDGRSRWRAHARLRQFRRRQDPDRRSLCARDRYRRPGLHRCLRHRLGGRARRAAGFRVFDLSLLLYRAHRQARLFLRPAARRVHDPRADLHRHRPRRADWDSLARRRSGARGRRAIVAELRAALSVPAAAEHALARRLLFRVRGADPTDGAGVRGRRDHAGGLSVRGQPARRHGQQNPRSAHRSVGSNCRRRVHALLERGPEEHAADSDRRRPARQPRHLARVRSPRDRDRLSRVQHAGGDDVSTQQTRACRRRRAARVPSAASALADQRRSIAVPARLPACSRD